MSAIKKLFAREILSSGAFPTVEVCCQLKSGVKGIASAPFGASAGKKEAYHLIDKDPKRYLGYGMLKAVQLVNALISKKLLGKNAYNQREIDKTLLQLDGTEDKKRLGGNAILATSMAVAKAQSQEINIPLYRYLRLIFKLPFRTFTLPSPMMVLIEGGKHAYNSTDIQEYLICIRAKLPVQEKVRLGIEVYLRLKDILRKIGYSTNVGNEGAYAPNGILSNELPLKYITSAIKKVRKNKHDIGIGLDVAASELYMKRKYQLTKEHKSLSSSQMSVMLKRWTQLYPIISIEDPLDENDWQGWQMMTKMLGKKILIVGDDLIATNIKLLKKAISLQAINSVIIKPNQIGTISETIDCAQLAASHHIATIVSHRGGGETNDTCIADLAVALNSQYLKVGPSRGERVEKYNRLMEIAHTLRQ